MSAVLFDATNCLLGEGPMWHPLRQELIWFDILQSRMLIKGAGQAEIRQMPGMTSAAGWVDEDRLVLASETALSVYSLGTGKSEILVPLEADVQGNRSNDGRADRQGGFWIGTMGKAKPGPSGAIYRFYKGELRRLYAGVAIPNSICFSPDGRIAYWANSADRQIRAQALDAEGWPVGEPRIFATAPEGMAPDGSVVDAAGHLWNARWGAGEVAEYAPDGRLLRTIPVPPRHSSCPAFIGADLTSLVCTSALKGTGAEAGPDFGPEGQTFRIDGLAPGLADGPVLL